MPRLRNDRILILFLACLLLGCEETNEPPLTELKPAHLRVSPERLDFGTFPTGFSSSKDIILYNSGQVNLIFENIEFEGFHDSFSLTPTVEEIGIKDSITLTLQFSPTLPQSFETQLLFYFEGDNSPLTIPIVGSSIENPICGPCDTPPGSYCIDEKTLAIYEKSSEGCEDDQCLFVAQDVLCNIGCDLQIQSCISLDAGVVTTTTPPVQNVDVDGGLTLEDAGASQSSISPNDANEGSSHLFDSGTMSETADVYAVAIGNIQSCYHCTDWQNPTTCSVSQSNCDLNQTIGYGQENDHPQNTVLDFTPIENETLFKDNNTGLIWSRCVNGSLNSPCDAQTQRQTWSGAQDLCAQRTSYLGQGFRLPSVSELLTLVNYASATHLLANENFDLPQDIYWTSAPVEPLNPLTDYWTLNAVEEKLVGSTVQDQGQVLCVSGNVNGTAALQSDNAMVSDARTQLIWQKCRHGQNENTAGTCDGTVLSLPFHEALSHCENLNLGSHTDWRLPSIRELSTLALYAEDPDLISEFGELGIGVLGQHWSATPHLTATAVWVFHLGASYWQKGGSSQTLRCVRSP